MLDLSRLVDALREFAQAQAEHARVLGEMAAEAAQRLRRSEAEWRDLAERVSRARTSWLLASPLENPLVCADAPPAPSDYIALASDGSQIFPDRYELALCYLLNVGTASIRYGSRAEARLTSTPELRFREDEIVEVVGGRLVTANRQTVSLERDKRESEALQALMRDTQGAEGVPAIALADGTLILWTLQDERDESRRRAGLAPMRELLALGREMRMPVVGYISQPGSRDVINMLRVLACPYAEAQCELFCGADPSPMRPTAPCAGVEQATDAMLFSRLLERGQRSGVFQSHSSILEEYDPRDRICFAYVHVGYEVARIEFPRWIAEDTAILDLVHCLVVDQANKGLGYPRALTEAHEQAVVRGPERALFFEMLQKYFGQQHVAVRTSRKALSKRIRSV